MIFNLLGFIKSFQFLSKIFVSEQTTFPVHKLIIRLIPNTLETIFCNKTEFHKNYITGMESAAGGGTRWASEFILMTDYSSKSNTYSNCQLSRNNLVNLAHLKQTLPKFWRTDYSNLSKHGEWSGCRNAQIL